MQKVNEELGDYSDILDTDFFDWEDDDIVSENVQFSDVENVIGSEKLIRSLQYTNYKLRSQNRVSPLHQEGHSCDGNIAAFTCKEIQFSKFNTLNAFVDHDPRKDHKQMDILSREKLTSNTKKKLDEDSDDFCSPNKKRKRRKLCSINDSNYTAPVEETPYQGASISQSDSLTISSQSSGSQMASVSSQGSCDSKMITSSQEISTCQKMITSSQETSASQNTTFSQECTSPKRITSSQESLGNQVMKIAIKEDSNIMSTASQSSAGTEIVITPHQNNSKCQQILTLEKAKSSTSNILNEGTTDSKYLTAFDQNTLGNKAFSSKKTKFSISQSVEKNKITESLASSVSDSFCNKTYKRCNKTEKRMIWSIRKRELRVTKRENAAEIREKQLDAREADILKREEILKTKERKYFRCKATMKKWSQEFTNNSKKLSQKFTNHSKKLRRAGVLEDETNAFNKIPVFNVFK